TRSRRSLCGSCTAAAPPGTTKSLDTGLLDHELRKVDPGHRSLGEQGRDGSLQLVLDAVTDGDVGELADRLVAEHGEQRVTHLRVASLDLRRSFLVAQVEGDARHQKA